MWLTVPEVAERTGVSGTTVRRWINDGYLRAMALPGNEQRTQWRIRKSDLDEFITNLNSNRATSDYSDEG